MNFRWSFVCHHSAHRVTGRARSPVRAFDAIGTSTMFIEGGGASIIRESARA